MPEAVAVTAAENGRRRSLIGSTVIAVTFLVVSIVFAANTQWYFVFKMLHVGAAVVWVGGGLFLTICAIMAELARDDDQLLQVGYWAESLTPIALEPLVAYVRGQRAHHGDRAPAEAWEANLL